MFKQVCRFFPVWIILILLFTSACAEPITICGVEFDTEDEYIDFGKVGVENIQELAEAIPKMPNLRKVDMFATNINKQNMAYLFDTFPEVTFGGPSISGNIRSVRTRPPFPRCTVPARRLLTRRKISMSFATASS